MVLEQTLLNVVETTLPSMAYQLPMPGMIAQPTNRLQASSDQTR